MVEVKDGFVYVASNPLLREGVYKVGRSERHPRRRLAELIATGVPAPFELIMYAPFDDVNQAENMIHRNLSEHRQSGEFFLCSIEVIKEAFVKALAENSPSSVNNRIIITADVALDSNSTSGADRWFEKVRDGGPPLIRIRASRWLVKNEPMHPVSSKTIAYTKHTFECGRCGTEQQVQSPNSCDVYRCVSCGEWNYISDK